MSDRFQDKYRIPSARASWWDYGRDGAYFITICIQDRNCYLGNVVNGKMELTGIGEIAQSCWQEIPQHFPFVQLDSFVVMPNHVHGIIIIEKSNRNTEPGHVETLHATSLPPTMMPTSLPTTSTKPVASSAPLETSDIDILHTETLETETLHTEMLHTETLHATSLQMATPLVHVKNEHMAAISPKRGTLGSIVRSYKSAVTNKAHLIHAEIAWQARYYDNIIRDDQSWQTISEYISNNPAKWEDDKFYIQ